MASRRRALALPGALGAALVLSGCAGTTTVVPGPATTTAPASEPAAPSGRPLPSPPAMTSATRREPPAPPAGPAGRPAGTLPPQDTRGVLVERPANFPNRGEAFLLARLHPGIARRCTRARPDSTAAAAVAGLECDTEAALGIAAFYDLFPTVVATEAAYGRYRRANAVPLDRGDCLASEPASLPAEGPWRAGRDLGAGRAMCLRAAGRTWLVSSHPPARILTYISASGPEVPAALWRRAAAPTARPR